MTHSQEQSVKERLRTLSKERDLTFAEVWQNLVLERFLARLSKSEHRSHFILKGGRLLAHYIDLGRETRDLDFLVEHMANRIDSLSEIIGDICRVDLGDAFTFEKLRIDPLVHQHMCYSGVQVALLARLGKTKTHVQIDLGFGDIVESVVQSIEMTSTRKGPLFESQVQLKCYPKEFIFAEKLETVIYRGGGNSRMKDFHDLYSLISLREGLDLSYVGKVVTSVFDHRQSSMEKLPISFDADAISRLKVLWSNYHGELKSKGLLPPLFIDVISAINSWLEFNLELDALGISPEVLLVTEIQTKER